MRCVSPWYNRTGWLGVKHQLTYSLCTHTQSHTYTHMHAHTHTTYTCKHAPTQTLNLSPHLSKIKDWHTHPLSKTEEWSINWSSPLSEYRLWLNHERQPLQWKGWIYCYSVNLCPTLPNASDTWCCNQFLPLFLVFLHCLSCFLHIWQRHWQRVQQTPTPFPQR